MQFTLTVKKQNVKKKYIYYIYTYIRQLKKSIVESLSNPIAQVELITILFSFKLRFMVMNC